MVWNISQMVSTELRSGIFFLCPNCMGLNEEAVVKLYAEDVDVWRVAPLEGNDLDWLECIDSEPVESADRLDYAYMSDCKCKLSNGFVENYIVEVDAESKIIKAVGDYWKHDGLDKLVKFAREKGFQVISG